MHKIKMTVEDINAKEAQEYLAAMETNRAPRPHMVARYAGDMASGRWNGNTAETIKFNTNGELIDGQHRLLAVVRALKEEGAPKTVRLAFARGVAEDAQNYVDTGLARSGADILSLSGIANSGTVAAISRLAIMYEEGGLDGMNNPSWRPSNARILEFAQANLDLQASAGFADSPLMRGLVPKRVAGFLHYTTVGIDQKAGVVFMEKIRDGVDLSVDEPELRLRNLFISNKARRRSKIPIKLLLAYSAKAWNARVEGRIVKRFSITRDEEWPVFVDVK